MYDKILCFITGRRSLSYFVLKTLDGVNIHKSTKVKALKLIETRKSYLTKRRQEISLTT